MEISLDNKMTKALKRFCKASWQELCAYGDEYIVGDDETKKFIFKDNGSDVLMVAHTDSVYPFESLYDLKFSGKRTVMAATLDDRLGVFTICEFLPNLLGDNVYDILLTDGEERGRSTAMYFEPPRQYNWICEFDRRGDDLVFYQYGGNLDAVRELKKAGFKIGIGSFSDIAELDHCGCTAFNVGVGYQNEHSPMAYMNVAEYLQQMKYFLRFWHAHKNTFFPFVRTIQFYVPTAKYLTPYANPYRYDEDFDDDSAYRHTKPNSLSPKTWSPWYDKDDEREARGLCEICDAMLPVKKVGDIYLCEDCRAIFKDEVHEYESEQIKTLANSLAADDDAWLECDGCNCCYEATAMAFVDFEDGLGEQLFCQLCRNKYGMTKCKVYPLVGSK